MVKERWNKMPPQDYRRYIKSQISKETEEELKEDIDLIREVLAEWIKRRNLRPENKMVRDIMKTCSRLITYPMTVINEEKINLECFLTYTHEHNPNILETERITELEALEGYVKEIYPLIRIRLDVESRYSHKVLRIRQIDVLDLVNLFDDILKRVKDKNMKADIEKLMNKFVYNSIYSHNEYL